MVYILLILMGIIAGSIINAYIYWDERDCSIYKWYSGLFYKQVKYLVPGIVLAVINVLIYNHFKSPTQVLSYALLSTLLMAAAIKDIKGMIIPNILILVGIIAGFIMVFINPALSLAGAFLGLVCGGGILWFIAFITKGGIGMGDVKLFACAGIFLGLQDTLSAMLVSTVLSGAAGLVMLVIRTHNRKSTMPFAPFISAGTILTILIR